MHNSSANGVLTSGVHHIVAVVFLSVYGHRVCNFISGLDVLIWISTVLPIALAQWAARGVLASRVVSSSPAQARPRLAFTAEAAVFTAGGLAVGALNTLVHGFPAASGIKVMIGFAAVGLFAGADQAALRIMARFDEGGLAERVTAVRTSLFVRVGTTLALVGGFMVVIAGLLIMRVIEDGAAHNRATMLRLTGAILFTPPELLAP